jgi:hypothetical protein
MAAALFVRFMRKMKYARHGPVTGEERIIIRLKSLDGRDHSEDLDTDGRIIDCNNRFWGNKARGINTRVGLVAGSCGQGNEPPGCTTEN